MFGVAIFVILAIIAFVFIGSSPFCKWYEVGCQANVLMIGLGAIFLLFLVWKFWIGEKLVDSVKR